MCLIHWSMKSFWRGSRIDIFIIQHETRISKEEMMTNVQYFVQITYKTKLNSQIIQLQCIRRKNSANYIIIKIFEILLSALITFFSEISRIVWIFRHCGFFLSSLCFVFHFGLKKSRNRSYFHHDPYPYDEARFFIFSSSLFIEEYKNQRLVGIYRNLLSYEIVKKKMCKKREKITLWRI